MKFWNEIQVGWSSRKNCFVYVIFTLIRCENFNELIIPYILNKIKNKKPVNLLYNRWYRWPDMSGIFIRKYWKKRKIFNKKKHTGQCETITIFGTNNLNQFHHLIRYWCCWFWIGWFRHCFLHWRWVFFWVE